MKAGKELCQIFGQWVFLYIFSMFIGDNERRWKVPGEQLKVPRPITGRDVTYVT